MRLFKFALPVLFAAGVALFAARAWSDATDASSLKLAQEHARHLFSQRAAIARAAPDTEHYRNDLRALLRGWFAEQTDLANRFPLLRGQPAAFVPAPPRVRGGDLREWQELADLNVAAWREGRVDLIESATSQGLRLDLLRVTKVAAPQPHLSVDVAIWGAPEETESDEAQAGKLVQRVTVPLVFKGLGLRFFDADGKLLARMDAGGEPALRLDVPARLAYDAPPGLILARFEPAPFPPGVAEVEWTLAAQVRTAAGDTRVAQGVFKTKVDAGWSGAAWDDHDKVVTETSALTRRPPSGVEQASDTHEHVAHGAKLAVWPTRE